MLLKDILIEEINEPIKSTAAISGGDINDAYVAISDSGSKYFIKINEYLHGNEMLRTEAMGLKLLADKSHFAIPNVIASGSLSNKHYLILEHFDKGVVNSKSWTVFTENLVSLHSQTNNYFGLDHNNFIGPLPQDNSTKDTWCDFFCYQRIFPLLKIGIEKGIFDNKLSRQEDKLYNSITDIIPEESPSLIHGDLWAGNYMVIENGVIALIDPAVYYGHREMDLAMMQLFGGYPKQVFNLYNERYPLEDEFEERIHLFQLYPILVHAILFEGAYIKQALSIFKSYT